MKIYIRSSSYAWEAVNQIYYRPLNNLAEQYKYGSIPPMVLLDFLTECIPKMKEENCLPWFLDHFVDPVSGTILSNGPEEYDQNEIESIMQEANAYAFAFEELGFSDMANHIIDNINRAKQEIGDNL